MALCLAAATEHHGPKDLADVHAMRLPIYLMPKILLNGFVISFFFCTFLQLKVLYFVFVLQSVFVGAMSGGVPHLGGGVSSLFLLRFSLGLGLWRSCSVTGFISGHSMQ